MGHLTLPERVLIENAPRARKGFKEIARLVGHSHATVKQEVVKHALKSKGGGEGARDEPLRETRGQTGWAQEARLQW